MFNEGQATGSILYSMIYMGKNSGIMLQAANIAVGKTPSPECSLQGHWLCLQELPGESIDQFT